jgi:hypothetical protein
MSSNLYFLHLKNIEQMEKLIKDSEGSWEHPPEGEYDTIEFPFQTPSDLTFAMMELSSTKYRMWLLSGWMNDEGSWTYDSLRNRLALMDKIESLLNDPLNVLNFW